MNFRFGLMLSALCVATASAASYENDYTLTHGNSAMTVFLVPNAGVQQWTVDGLVQLSGQQFFYRVGDVGGEASIYSLPIVESTLLSPSMLRTSYANEQFALEIVYSLLGGTPGSGLSSLSEQVKITNLTDTLLDFQLFEYADFDLGSVSEGDTIQLGRNLDGFFNEALQSKDGLQFAEAVYRPGATSATVGLASSLFADLTDANPSTLDGNSGPFTGDAAYAVQWDSNIVPGGSMIFGLDKTLSVTPIPEPSIGALWLIGVGLVGCIRRWKVA